MLRQRDEATYSEKDKSYPQIVDDTCAKRNNAKSIAFTKSDSKDLFYALHLVSSNFHYTKKHPVHIHDKFDFKYMASYRSPFTAAVNNWAFLCSNIDVLYPSKINIYF